MIEQEARLERLLARHRDALVVEPVAGLPTLIRRDQLLVAEPDVPAVEDMVRRWYDAREDGHGVCRLRLRAPAKVDVCELAAQLGRGGRHRTLAVAPNHLVYGQPMWWSGPADLPRPAPPSPAPVAGERRREVTVAMLDTGLSAHPWYEDTAWFAEQRDEVEEILDADLDSELDTQAGHGTFIAGVLLRHAPTARIAAQRVLGGDGIGDELDVIRALGRIARSGGVDVVNISLGCHSFDDRPSAPLTRAIGALGRLTVVVACAGNAGHDRPFWPAALKPVIGVAALDGEERAWFSNYGWWVDASAPGVGVRSCFVRFDGPRPRADGVDPDAFQGYATWSGTSFAAPAVAGRVAALVAAEGLDPIEAADRLLDPATTPTRPDLGAVFTA